MVPVLVDFIFSPHFKSGAAKVNPVRSPTCMGGYNPLAWLLLITQNSDSFFNWRIIALQCWLISSVQHSAISVRMPPPS